MYYVRLNLLFYDTRNVTIFALLGKVPSEDGRHLACTGSIYCTICRLLRLGANLGSIYCIMCPRWNLQAGGEVSVHNATESV